MRRGWPALVGAACTALGALVAAGCGGPSLGALAGKTPRQVLTVATAAAQSAGGVHYQLSAVQGSERQSITGDAGVNEGDQERVTGADDAVVELVGGTAYLRANASALQDTFHLPAAQATTYAGRWISVAPSDSLYAPISESVTLAAVVGQLLPTGTLREEGPTSLDGQHVVGVQGALPGQVESGVTGSAVFWVDTRRPDVPVAFTGQASNGHQRLNDTGVFNRWGEKVALVAPSGAVPYSSIPTS